MIEYHIKYRVNEISQGWVSVWADSELMAQKELHDFHRGERVTFTKIQKA